MSDRPARLSVRVQPGASHNAIVRLEEGVLHVRIAAPPVKGRANRELIGFLSEVLGVPRSSVTVERGATSRTKVLRIEGLSQEDVRGRVENSLP